MLVSAIHQHGLATSIGSFGSLPPISTASHPSRLSQSPSLSSLSHTANSHWLSILHMLVYMFSCYCLHATLSILPPSPSCSRPLVPSPLRAHKSALHVCLGAFAKIQGSSPTPTLFLPSHQLLLALPPKCTPSLAHSPLYVLFQF